MTPDELRAIRERMPGRIAEERTAALAELLDCTPRTVRNKMSGQTPISKGDEALLARFRKPKRAARRSA